MTVTYSFMCFTITILLVNVNLASSLELTQPLYRVQRAVLSENPTEELNSLINTQLSRSNVQSLLKGILPGSLTNLRSRLANEDLLEEFVRPYVEHPDFKASLLQGDDVSSVLVVLNSELGGPILIKSNESIIVDIDALEDVLIAYSEGYIQEAYKDDIFLQVVLKATVEAQIEEAISEIRPYLADIAIPLELANEIISVTNDHGRSKRDINSLILDLIRPQLAAILTPIQLQINTVFNNVISVILSFYVATQPSVPILATITNVTNVLVVRGAEILIILQGNINAVFTNLINGTVSSSRKRREIDLEFDNLYDFDRVDLIISHRRVTRSINPIEALVSLIAGLLNIIITNLNALVKTIFIKILSTQYGNIGQLVTTPLRDVVNWLINIVLPCSTCASIV